MGGRWRARACLIVACLLLASSATAQVGAGALAGNVADQAGAPVPGAAVTITAVGTGTSRTTFTSPDGAYVVTGLSPGRYRVQVALDGFRPLTREGVQLATGETVRLDLQLEVGGVAEAVTVIADAPLLRSESSGLGHVVDNRKIVDLPLNGRSFISLATLVPGVAVPPPPAAPLPRINGGRPRTNEYLFDGISVLQPEPGQVAFFPNVDAIQEFKIESNSPPAEFGRFNGGVVNLTTKSGSNAVRGTAFEFLRHESLNARNFFAASNPVKPKFRRNQFGGVLGGPIRRDRTFFFVDYQGQRQTIGRTVISTVPTTLQRQGIFTEAIAGRVPVIYDPRTTVPIAGGGVTRNQFAGNAIPLDRIDPVARALLERYPLPTSGGTANNYRRTDNETVDQDQFSVRVDQRFTERDQVFGRLTRFQETFVPVTPLPDGSGSTSGTLGPQDTTSWSFASSYQRTFSGTLLNELRIGDTRRAVARNAAQLSTSASSALNLPGIPSTARFPNTLPTFLIAGYQQLGSPPNTATDFSTSVTQIADTLTWVKGRHTLKMGADLRWERLNVLQPPSPTGSFTFSTLFTNLSGVTGTGNPLASFLLGQVQQFSIDLQQNVLQPRAWFQEWFVQDDWKVTSRLTMNLGTRYTLNFPSTEANDRGAVFNLQTQELQYLGQDGFPHSARQLHWKNFGPRVGISYLLSKKTVVRSGYGLTFFDQAGITTPFTIPQFPFVQTASQSTLDNKTPAFVLANGPSVQPVDPTPDAGLGQGVFSVDRGLGSGYVQQWNLTVQREVTPSLSFEVAYVGSKATHLGVPDVNLNQLTVDQLALGGSLTQTVANPFFGQLPPSSSLGGPTISQAQLLKPFPRFTNVTLFRNNVGNSDYHAVQAKLEKRFSRGLTLLVSYTRSKLIDDASSVFDASIFTGPIANFPVADSFNRRLEQDVSNGDIPNYFVASWVYELPIGPGHKLHPSGLLGKFTNGWQIAGIATIESGIPLALTQTTNFNAFAGFGTQRPNCVGDPTPDHPTTAAYFNLAAFAIAPQFTLGTCSRNPVRGPGYQDADLAFIKRTNITERYTLDFRTEIFNLTNTPPLNAPNVIFGSAAFGTITSAGDPRVIQFALKLNL